MVVDCFWARLTNFDRFRRAFIARLRVWTDCGPNRFIFSTAKNCNLGRTYWILWLNAYSNVCYNVYAAKIAGDESMPRQQHTTVDMIDLNLKTRDNNAMDRSGFGLCVGL